ncbi:hypothetical protein RFI_26683 [Reticulomyxa filosa]|uniref:Kelch domain-containing protein n=1 Tax=Reticulomyxa filosa TaxID=46433 RepID=X6M9W8_RETFI|nr:hypothetical protein RFI_26683 [Reticulomyxa filosa]|eukprot:ETO10694.1 hypothetical protein RFI_26683 [Reticulomyxa filosa]
MGNQSTTPFQDLKDLPTSLYESQCVLHKHEILICGGYKQSACYSYHTLKNEYKLICNYPYITLWGYCGHCVVKLADINNKDSNEITLLSFGGSYKHTLMMKYVSVWSDDNEMNKSKKSNNHNEWIPFTDNHNNLIHIGRNEDNYCGVRAVIGGSNNHLLFITYGPKNISVFDLNTLQFIKHDVLPIYYRINYHCFISKSENGQGQAMVKTNEEKNKIRKKKNNEMLLFCEKTGLSIEYDENNNNFQFHRLHVCDDIDILSRYAYVYINDAILFFAGNGFKGYNYIASKSVHKYLIQEQKWITFDHTLPIPLHSCFGILNEDNTHIHIIGGIDDRNAAVSTHMKTKVNIWRDASQLSSNEIKLAIQYWIRILKIKLGWINDFEKIIIKYSRIQ